MQYLHDDAGGTSTDDDLLVVDSYVPSNDVAQSFGQKFGVAVCGTHRCDDGVVRTAGSGENGFSLSDNASGLSAPCIGGSVANRISDSITVGRPSG